MKKYLVQGGNPVKGTIRIGGNKNAALPCLAATLLTDEEVILRDIPDIEDVGVMIRILKALGSDVRRIDRNTLCIRTTDIKTSTLPYDEAIKVRASILFIGSLIARTGEAELPPPGGDVIGKRRLDSHFLAMRELGVSTDINGVLKFSSNGLKGADIFLDEASVTATENTLMAAALADGVTIIRNAASEPHVQDLCNMLTAMGSRIDGIGSNILTIEGKKKLYGTDFTIGSDFMETGSLIGLAAVTKGTLEIENAGVKHLRMIALAFEKLGIHWESNGDTIYVPADQPLKVSYDIGGVIPKIDDAPWPGFPPDLTSIMVVVATQSEGTILIHEKMFESRLFFVDKLIGMGARITLCDPHRAVVSGSCSLHPDDVVSPDVRAGMAVLLAALCANGESVIHNVYQIERGYENLVERLNQIGANIRIEDE